jgi:hypothetical protein
VACGWRGTSYKKQAIVQNNCSTFEVQGSTFNLLLPRSSSFKPRCCLFILPLALLALGGSTPAAVRYVDAHSTSPAPPYTNWTTAAADIQHAVDAAAPGDEIVVTNGLYATGGRAVYGALTNRVVVTEGVKVRSVNGPAVTVIVGAEALGGGNGDAAIRCVYVGAHAMLSGFSLTNGHTRAAGDFSKEQGGGGAWLEPSGVVTNCTLAGNSAYFGGGVCCWGGTLDNCTLTGNSGYFGGGASDGTLNNCALTGNSAVYAGGAYGGKLNSCTLTGNLASRYGGGAYLGTLSNCIAYYNTAPAGPNYYGSTFAYCCTKPLPAGPGNLEAEPLLASASHLSAQSPCIDRGSAAGTSGVDIDGEAWLNPPCIGADQFVPGQTTGPLTLGIAAGYTNVGTGFAVPFEALIEGRLAGSVWEFGDGVVVSNRPYLSHAWDAPGEYLVRLTGYNDSYPGGISATVLVQVATAEVYYVNASNATPVPPHTNWPSAARTIQEAVDAGTQIGRLVLVADGVYGAGGRAVYGALTNRVVVTEGVEVQSLNGPAVTAIAGAGAPGGGNGDGAIRCAYVGTNAVLSGFTLTNGHTRAAGDYFTERSGGGAWCEASGVVTNCTLSGNSAAWDGGGVYRGTLNNCSLAGNSATNYGGGASGGTLNNCTLRANLAFSLGGGAHDGTLNNCILRGNWAGSGGGTSYGEQNNCTLTGNSASRYGGGAYCGMLNNCIVYYNSAPTNPNYDDGTFGMGGSRSSIFAYGCTTPLPTGGAGNFTNAPLFVDYVGGNLRLQTNSPCINAGNNANAVGATDLDGRARLVGGRVDVGAYEFQGAGLGEFIGWLQQYGLPADGSADTTDGDHDGHNNWQEWVAGTIPTNALSALRLQSPVINPPGVLLRWTSVSNRSYYIERATNLVGTAVFSLLQANIQGLSGTTGFTDTNLVGAGLGYYRIGVQP